MQHVNVCGPEVNVPKVLGTAKCTKIYNCAVSCEGDVKLMVDA